MKSVRKPGLSIRQLLKQATRFRNVSFSACSPYSYPLILFVVNVSGQGGWFGFAHQKFRVRGPNGANDECVEVTHNSSLYAMWFCFVRRFNRLFSSRFPDRRRSDPSFRTEP